MTDKRCHTLFPSASTSVSKLPTTDTSDQSWLTNKSYTGDTEKKLVEFQKELKKYQNNHRIDTDNVVDDDDDDKEEDVYRRGNTGADSKKQVISPEYSGDERREKSKAIGSEQNKRHYKSSDDSGDERRERKKKKKHKHKKKHKKEKYQTQEEIRTEKSDVFAKNKIFLEELGDISQSSAYRLDRHADGNSWTYGSLYKLHIAKYKHFSPICLGTGHTRQVLLYDIKKSSKHKPWDIRYFGKENRSYIKSIGEPVTSDMPDVDVTGSYVELKTAIQESDKTVDVRQRILDESTSAYVKGQAGKEQYHATVDNEPIIKGPLERKVEEFNRKLREETHNIKLWLDFIKFQDTLFTEDNVLDEDTSAKERVKISSQALLDKKLSILDKAFEANPGNIELHLRKLELCSDIWEPTRINKELEQLLFVHPANVELWNQYLRFNQSRISIFTVTKMTKLYQKCFKTLFGVLEGKIQTHSVPSDLQERVLEIFYRYCLFLRDSGYREKALTTLQAMLEFNLFCSPTLMNAPRETQMASFEEYWEGCGARLGFPGALGWKCWGKEKTSVYSTTKEESLEELEESVIEKKLAKSETWLQIEALRETHHWLPWQPDMSAGQTEEDCEDPERLVMFDDISPVLFTVTDSLHLQLVVFFLGFSGLSLTQNYLVPVKQCCKRFILDNSGLSDVLVSMKKLPFFENSQGIPENLSQFITLALQQIASGFEGLERTIIILLLIEFQTQTISEGKTQLSKSDKKEIRKILKNILKEEHNRNNLIVWHAYVTIERYIGKQGEAEAILETALAMHSGKDISVVNEDTLGLLSLYRIYCELILQMGASGITALWERQGLVSKDVKQKVVQVLHCALENKKCVHNKLEAVSATAQLKMRSKLKKLIEAGARKLSEAANSKSHEINYMYFLELCVCSGLLEFCSSGLEACQNVYQSFRDLVQTIRMKEIVKHQMRTDLYREEIRLILYHMASVSAPLSVLRTCLEVAMAHYPNEADFLKLFVEIEKRSRISGRLHRHFDGLLNGLTSPVPAVIAISSQLECLHRIREAGGQDETSTMSQSGIVHKTRSWLERCLAQSVVQNCPMIWRLYLLLEEQYGDAARLKGIFYRSIQQCPGVKDLYMSGVNMFGDQLQELVDMMTEKEIRVQIPVEELDILISD